MRHTHSIIFPNEIEHPACARCGAPMWLSRIEPEEKDTDRRTFECQACGATTMEIVKYR